VTSRVPRLREMEGGIFAFPLTAPSFAITCHEQSCAVAALSQCAIRSSASAALGMIGAAAQIRPKQEESSAGEIPLHPAPGMARGFATNLALGRMRLYGRLDAGNSALARNGGRYAAQTSAGPRPGDAGLLWADPHLDGAAGHDRPERRPRCGEPHRVARRSPPTRRSTATSSTARTTAS
jgi:hypothetical protein